MFPEGIIEKSLQTQPIFDARPKNTIRITCQCRISGWTTFEATQKRYLSWEHVDWIFEIVIWKWNKKYKLLLIYYFPYPTYYIPLIAFTALQSATYYELEGFLPAPYNGRVSSWNGIFKLESNGNARSDGYSNIARVVRFGFYIPLLFE